MSKADDADSFAEYLTGTKLLLDPKRPDVVIFSLITVSGNISYFAMPRSAAPGVFGQLAMDAQALESGAPIPPKPGKAN